MVCNVLLPHPKLILIRVLFSDSGGRDRKCRGNPVGLNNPEAWQVRGEDPRVARTALHLLIKVLSSF